MTAKAMPRRAISAGLNGVEVRPSSIRMQFRFGGEIVREPFTLNGIPLEPTPSNIQWANRQAILIKTAIRTGTFEFADYFPASVRALPPPVNSFGALCDDFFKSKGELLPATKKSYRLAIVIWKNLLGADTPIDKLTYKVLASKLGEHPWTSPQVFNAYLIPLRGVFAYQYHGQDAMTNPMLGIKNRKKVKKKPDPLTPDERDLTLVDMAEHYDPRVTAYFEFAFFTGMRPEEIVALRWSDIDFRSGSARIRRVRTFGGEREGSKTHAERDVELVSQALRAIEAMRPFTYLRGPEADVFERPEFVPKRVLNLKTGMSYNAGKSNPAGPWLDSRSQSETFWKPTLLRLGIRARRAYNARHTFATTALSAGVAPGYIATQLGHANTKMLHEVYSRWNMGADKGVQRAAMEAAMSGAGDDPEKPLVPKTYPKSGLKIVSR